MLPKGEIIQFNGLFISERNPARNNCVLVLTGTSTQIEDITYFIGFLEKRGHAVAAVERFIGGPFDVRYDPIKERDDTLKSALTCLIETHKVENIHVVAHSYAAFEIIRLISKDPLKYSGHISNIILVNPAGFTKKSAFIRHCLRFIFLFILKEYWYVGQQMIIRRRGHAVSKEFLNRKLHTTSSLFLKTLRNPYRSFKEAADIVSFKVRPYIKELIQAYQYSFHVFINTDDSLVAPDETLDALKDLLPTQSLLRCPGNHMDLFIDANQMNEFNSFLTGIMECKC